MKIRKLNEELEQRVAHRTSELEEANDRLQGEATQRRQAEDVLAQRAEELTRSNVELERFAYVTSHDLQEPLRGISGCLQILEKRYGSKLDGSANEFISHAVDGAARMRALIEDLLAYSRVGTRDTKFAPTDCATVFDEVVINLRTAVEESGALLTRGDLATVTANEGQLTQLLQNLIGNAIKFRADRQPRIHVRTERKGDDWVFSVSDNGIGLAAEYAERIFVLFQRLHTRTEYPGTGMGLAICRKIVERHGGRIWVESVPGKGSTFFFTIPA